MLLFAFVLARVVHSSGRLPDVSAPVKVVSAAVPAPPAVPQLAPAPRWTRAQVARLDRGLRAGFAASIDGARRYSLVVLSQRGRVIFHDRARRGSAPASTQKLIVASTALAVLGPEYRFHTLLAASAPPRADGSLAGDLWLIGSGDPSLTYRDLTRGVSDLVRRGLRRVDGGVAVDAHSIAGPGVNPLWNQNDDEDDYQPPTSGISLDEDNLHILVAGTNPGAPAHVWSAPPADDVVVHDEVVTQGGIPSNVIVGMGTALNHFVVSGNIRPGIVQKYSLPIHGVAHYAGDVLASLLASRGVSTDAPPGVGSAPLDSVVLWDHASAPSWMLEHHMLIVSDNHYAEQLMRTLGGVRYGIPDDAHGLRVERHFLARTGVPTPELHLVDGSGLAHVDRIAAITLATILLKNPALARLLPKGGKQGTLTSYDFTTALGRVRAKTGHLDGVSALAGYVWTAHHGRVIFAFSVNDSPADPDDAMIAAVDRIAAM